MRCVAKRLRTQLDTIRFDSSLGHAGLPVALRADHALASLTHARACVNLLYTLGLDDEQQHRSAVLLIAGTSCARDAWSSTEAGATSPLAAREATPPGPYRRVLEKVSPACRIGTIVFVERIRGSHSGGP